VDRIEVKPGAIMRWNQGTLRHALKNVGTKTFRNVIVEVKGPPDRRLRGDHMNHGTMTPRDALRVLGLTAAAAGLGAGAPAAAAPTGEVKVASRPSRTPSTRT